jgi:hypothetical protein
MGFCTPLYCAANSGWLSHTVALVKAGAKVYTGSRCSPLCWTKGGSASSHPVARYLRVEIGDVGLTKIEQYHASVSQTPYKKTLPRDEKPLFRTQVHHHLNRHGHCSVCSELSVEELMSPAGYRHLLFEDLRKNAVRCNLCRVILSLLTEDQERNFAGLSHVIIRASTKSQLDGSEDISVAPICMLEVKLSAGCTCNSSVWNPEPSPDFSNCRRNHTMIAQSATAIFTNQGMST